MSGIVLIGAGVIAAVTVGAATPMVALAGINVATQTAGCIATNLGWW